MQEKLKALSDEAILRLREQVAEEYERRRGRMLKVGGLAMFHNRKTGEDVTIRITGRGSVNFTGVKVDEFGRDTTMKWRVNPVMLKPILQKKQEPPKTSTSEAW